MAQILCGLGYGKGEKVPHEVFSCLFFGNNTVILVLWSTFVDIGYTF